MTYVVKEVDGVLNAGLIDHFNSLSDYFPVLEPHHHSNGHWWIAYYRSEPVAFAGLVPFEPFQKWVGYCKRCLVLPDHYGHGLQSHLLRIRIDKAWRLGWKQLVSDCAADNHHSANNFRREKFSLVVPEQLWAGPAALYWSRDL